MSLKRGFLAAVGLLLVGAAPAAAETVSFGVNNPGNPFHRWVVPATVCSATFNLYGAEGSAGAGGAQVTSTLQLTPGTAYDIFVGDSGTVGNGGYNGGGAAVNGGVGGGGATDVRIGPGLANRILVASGGGGNGGNSTANSGRGGVGALLGQNGVSGSGPIPGGDGKGATTAAGGAGATGGFVGAPGQLGVGGAGGSSGSYAGGGGGGGGLFGGGGGGGAYSGGAGGGGGGSSLTAGGRVSATPHPGKGKAEIAYNRGSCAQPDGGLQQGDKTKPTLGGLRFSSTVFKAAKSGAAISAKRKSKAKVGTKVSFTLSEASSVKFTVQRKASGRKVGKKCAKPKRSNRKKKKCTRWETVKGSFTLAGKAGKNTFTFRGRVGGKRLKPDSYRLNSQATDKAKNVSPLKHKAFKIVK